MTKEKLILIVDDNNQNLKVLSQMLIKKDYQIALANNGEKGLKFANKKDVDLILLDIMMPKMDGFEVCQKLKANDDTKEIPVIFISALQKTKKKLKAFEVGGTDYITKPFNQKEVMARVKTHLKLNEMKDNLKFKNEEQEILLDNIDTQIWYLKDEKTYGKVNNSRAQFMGLTKEELEGENLFKLLEKDEAERCLKRNREVFAKKEKIDRTEWLKNAMGEKRCLKITKTPKLDQEGNVQYVVCSAEDITEREEASNKLKDSEKKFRQIAENIREVFFIHSSDLEEMIYISPVYEKIWQRSCESLYNNPQKWMQTIHPDDQEKVKQAYYKMARNETEFNEEYRIIRKDGSIRWIRAKGFPVFNDKGEAYRYAGIAEDITERKIAEQKLKKRVDLEKISTKLSKKFIDLKKDNISSEIEKGLEMVADFIEVDYSYIHLFSADNKKIKDKFHWYRDGFAIEKLNKNTRNVSLANLPWLLNELKENNLIEISDVKNLPVEAKNFKEILSSEGIKSSLILPIRYNNKPIGILGFDSINEFKSWDDEEISLFKVIGDIFANALKRKEDEEKLNEYYLELELQKMEVERLYDDLESEFEKAKKLHQKFLPNDLPEIKGLTYETYFKPSKKLGGDFYDIVKTKDKLLFYLADVSGHGLDGSMMNIFLRETINNYLFYQNNEGTELKANELITYVADKYQDEDFPADYFICLLVGVLDTKKMEVSFANAGFQFPPIKVSNTGEISSLSCGGMPISSAVSEAMFIDLYMGDYEVETIRLAKGDTFFLTTDGLIEEVANGEVYGEERLKKVLANNYKLPANLITARVKNSFKKFAGSLVGQDDLTFLTLKRDLEIIDSFERRIESNIEKMHQLQQEALEFIDPYYEIPDLICIGFQEIITNAIEHGNKFDTNKEVKIEIEVTKEHIKTIITDQGEGFDWEEKTNQKLDIESDFEAGKERGRGIKISNKVYDEIWYNDKGNQAYLFKLRRNK